MAASESQGDETGRYGVSSLSTILYGSRRADDDSTFDSSCTLSLMKPEKKEKKTVHDFEINRTTREKQRYLETFRHHLIQKLER